MIQDSRIKLKYFLAIFAVLVIGVVFPILTLAANVGCDAGGYGYPWCKPGAPEGIAGLVSTFYNYALSAVGVAALGAIIYGAIIWITSAGAPGKIGEAKELITGAIFGVVLLVSAALLLKTINPELVELKEPGINKVEVTTSMTSSVGGPGGSGLSKYEWVLVGRDSRGNIKYCNQATGYENWIGVDNKNCSGSKPPGDYICCGEKNNK